MNLTIAEQGDMFRMDYLNRVENCFRVTLLKGLRRDINAPLSDLRKFKRGDSFGEGVSPNAQPYKTPSGEKATLRPAATKEYNLDSDMLMADGENLPDPDMLGQELALKMLEDPEGRPCPDSTGCYYWNGLNLSVKNEDYILYVKVWAYVAIAFTQEEAR